MGGALRRGEESEREGVRGGSSSRGWARGPFGPPAAVLMWRFGKSRTPWVPMGRRRLSRAPWVPMGRRRLSHMPLTIVVFLYSVSMGPAPDVSSLGACWTHDQDSGRAEDRWVLVVGQLLSFPMTFVPLVPRAPSRCPSSGRSGATNCLLTLGSCQEVWGVLRPVAWAASAASSLRAWPPALGSRARVSLPAWLVRGGSPSIHSAPH